MASWHGLQGWGVEKWTTDLDTGDVNMFGVNFWWLGLLRWLTPPARHHHWSQSFPHWSAPLCQNDIKALRTTSCLSCLGKRISNLYSMKSRKRKKSVDSTWNPHIPTSCPWRKLESQRPLRRNAVTNEWTKRTKTPTKKQGRKKDFHSTPINTSRALPSKELDDVVTLGCHGLLDKAFALLSRSHLTSNEALQTCRFNVRSCLWNVHSTLPLPTYRLDHPASALYPAHFKILKDQNVPNVHVTPCNLATIPRNQKKDKGLQTPVKDSRKVKATAALFESELSIPCARTKLAPKDETMEAVKSSKYSFYPCLTVSCPPSWHS